MWWANQSAVVLWNAATLDELVHRDFGKDMSGESAERLQDYLARFGNGERIKDQWTFYPNGQGSKTVITTASGLFIEGCRVAMLVEGVEKSLLDAAAEATLNGVEESAERSQKRQRTDDLLFDIFPRHVANALTEGRKVEPELKSEVTIFFADIVGFTRISSLLTPLEVSMMLDRLYEKLDALSRRHEVYKVETIGDCFMCCTNLILDQPDHCKRMVKFAFDAIQAANETLINPDQPNLGYIDLRVGMHAGPVVANVVGSRNPRYCLFGDSVNCASRMESLSEKNRIQCSDTVARLLKKQRATNIHLVPRGVIQVKGKGEMNPFWVEPNGALDNDLRVPKRKLRRSNSD